MFKQPNSRKICHHRPGVGHVRVRDLGDQCSLLGRQRGEYLFSVESDIYDPFYFFFEFLFFRQLIEHQGPLPGGRALLDIAGTLLCHLGGGL
jgi:hypothetical protein